MSLSVSATTQAGSPPRRWELFAVVMLILMDLSWITPAYMMVIGDPLGNVALTAFILFGVIYVTSYSIANLPRYLDVFIGMIQAILLVILFLGVIGAVSMLLYSDNPFAFYPTVRRYFSQLIRFSIPLKPELLISVVVFLVWRRGFSLANRNIGLGLMRRSFRMGSVVLVIVGAFAALFGSGFPYLEMALFIFTGLLAMGGARFSTLGSMRGSKRVSFKREWILGLLAMAVVVLGLSLGFGVFAAGPLSAWFRGFLMAIEGFLTDVLKVVLAPLINFLGIIFAWFWSLFEPPPVEDPTAVEALEEGLEGPITEIQQVATDPEFAAMLSTLGTVIGILLIVGIVYFAVRRFRKDSKPRVLGDEDSISMAGSLTDYLRGIQDRAKQVFEGVSRMNPAARLIAAARIRIIYARLLKLGSRLGQPREPAETPSEYLGVLDRVFPASRDELETITDAYMRVRYGELPESREEVAQVEEAWGVVRRRGRST